MSAQGTAALVAVGGICLVLFLWWGVRDADREVAESPMASAPDPDRGVVAPDPADVARYGGPDDDAKAETSAPLHLPDADR